MKKIVLYTLAIALCYITAFSQQFIKPKWTTTTASPSGVTTSIDGLKILHVGSWGASVLDTKTGTVKCSYDFMYRNWVPAFSGCFSRLGDKFVVIGGEYGINVRDANSGALLASNTDSLSGSIRSVCFNREGSKLAVYTATNIVKMIDVQTGKKLFEFGNKNETIIQTLANENNPFFEYQSGDIVVTEGKDSIITIWDLNTGAKLHSFQGKRGKKLVAHSDDGTKVLLYNSDFVIVYDVVKANIIYQSDQRGARVACFSRKGNKLIASDHEVRVINLETKSVELVVSDIAQVNYAEFNYKGDKIAISTNNESVYVCEVPTGKKISRLKGHYQSTRLVKFIGQSDSLITSDMSSNIKIWDVISRKVAFYFESGGAIKKLRFNKSNTHIIALPWTAIRLFESATGKNTFVNYSSTSRGEYQDVSFNYLGDLIAVASERDVTFFNIKGDSLAQTQRFAENVTAMCFFNKSNKLAVCYDNGLMRVWDVRTFTLLYTRTLGLVEITNITFAHDDTKFVVTHSYSGVSVFDTESGKELVLYSETPFSQADCQFSSKAKFLLSRRDTIQTVYSTENWGKFMVKKGSYSSIDNNENLLAVADYDSVTIWNLQTRELVTTLKGHLQIVRGVCFDPKNNRILTWSDDMTARLWSTVTGKQVAILVSNKSTVGTIAIFDETGSTLITGNPYGVIHAYDVSTLSTDTETEDPFTDDNNFCRIVNSGSGNTIRIELNEPALNNIQYSIHNILGDTIVTGALTVGSVDATLSMENKPTGYYVIVVHDKQNTVIKTVVHSN